MKTFAAPTNATEQKTVELEVKPFIRHWVGLLAERKYEAAIALLSPEIPDGSGSVSVSEATKWTPDLLEAVIANYGTPEPCAGQNHTYSVVPLDDSLRPAFEAALDISFQPFKELGRTYLGAVQVDLPVHYARGNAVGDLTARFFFRPLNENEMALVLLDIHVL